MQNKFVFGFFRIRTVYSDSDLDSDLSTVELYGTFLNMICKINLYSDSFESGWYGTLPWFFFIQIHFLFLLSIANFLEIRLHIYKQCWGSESEFKAESERIWMFWRIRIQIRIRTNRLDPDSKKSEYKFILHIMFKKVPYNSIVEGSESKSESE